MTTPARAAVPAAAIGLAGGLASGLFGIGGGLVVVPLLTLALGIPIKRAVGTSLLAMVLVTGVGVLTESLVAPANLRWLAALLLAVGTLAGSRLGTALAVRAPSATLAKFLAALLLLAALKLSGLLPWALQAAGLMGAPETVAAAGPSGPLAALAHVALGGLAGVLSALLGIGGGIVVVPALALLHPDWAFHACRATSLLMIVPGSAMGAWLHSRHGHVDARLAAALAPGAILGSAAGVFLANRAPGRALEIAFSVLLIVGAVQLSRRREPPVQAPA